jgi:hypothetical protein
MKIAARYDVPKKRVRSRFRERGQEPFPEERGQEPFARNRKASRSGFGVASCSASRPERWPETGPRRYLGLTWPQAERLTSPHAAKHRVWPKPIAIKAPDPFFRADS